MAIVGIFDSTAAPQGWFQHDAPPGWFDESLLDVGHTAGAYTLTALGGAYSLTGASATLKRNRSLTAQGGAYAAAGQSATVVVSKGIDARGSAGGRKAWHELTVEEVEQQWDLLDLRTKANTLEIPEGSPPVEVSDQNPVNNAGREAAMVSGPVNVAMPFNYQGILTSSPTDAAGEPLAPDQAAAAIEAKRQRNNKALAMLLMEL